MALKRKKRKRKMSKPSAKDYQSGDLVRSAREDLQNAQSRAAFNPDNLAGFAEFIREMAPKFGLDPNALGQIGDNRVVVGVPNQVNTVQPLPVPLNPIPNQRISDPAMTNVLNMRGLSMGVPTTSIHDKPPQTNKDRNKAIQQRLIDLGYDPGKVDGILGKNTGKAVRQFQEDQGLEPDGIIGPETMGALGSVAPGDDLSMWNLGYDPRLTPPPSVPASTVVSPENPLLPPGFEFTDAPPPAYAFGRAPTNVVPATVSPENIIPNMIRNYAVSDEPTPQGSLRPVDGSVRENTPEENAQFLYNLATSGYAFDRAPTNPTELIPSVYGLPPQTAEQQSVTPSGITPMYGTRFTAPLAENYLRNVSGASIPEGPSRPEGLSDEQWGALQGLVAQNTPQGTPMGLQIMATIVGGGVPAGAAIAGTKTAMKALGSGIQKIFKGKPAAKKYAEYLASRAGKPGRLKKPESFIDDPALLTQVKNYMGKALGNVRMPRGRSYPSVEGAYSSTGDIIQAQLRNPYSQMFRREGGRVPYRMEGIDPMFLGGFGKFLGKVGKGIFNAGKGAVDFSLSSFGMPNIIDNTFVDRSKQLSGITGLMGQIAPMALNVALPGAGTGLSALQGLNIGGGNNQPDLSAYGSMFGGMMPPPQMFPQAQAQPQVQSPTGGLGNLFGGLGSLLSLFGGLGQLGFGEKGGVVKYQAGGMVDLQAEKDEKIVWPDLSITDVHAKDTHAKMESKGNGNMVTDHPAAGSYIMSSYGGLKINKSDADRLELGVKRHGYSEHESGEEPEVYTLGDIFKKGERRLTPAVAAERIKDKFKTVDDDTDIFVQLTNQVNKANRRPYLTSLTLLSELERKKIDLKELLSESTLPFAKKGGMVYRHPNTEKYQQQGSTTGTKVVGDILKFLGVPIMIGAGAGQSANLFNTAKQLREFYTTQLHDTPGFYRDQETLSGIGRGFQALPALLADTSRIDQRVTDDAFQSINPFLQVAGAESTGNESLAAAMSALRNQPNAGLMAGTVLGQGIKARNTAIGDARSRAFDIYGSQMQSRDLRKNRQAELDALEDKRLQALSNQRLQSALTPFGSLAFDIAGSRRAERQDLQNLGFEKLMHPSDLRNAAFQSIFNTGAVLQGQNVQNTISDVFRKKPQQTQVQQPPVNVNVGSGIGLQPNDFSMQNTLYYPGYQPGYQSQFPLLFGG